MSKLIKFLGCWIACMTALSVGPLIIFQIGFEIPMKFWIIVCGIVAMPLAWYVTSEESDI